MDEGEKENVAPYKMFYTINDLLINLEEKKTLE